MFAAKTAPAERVAAIIIGRMTDSIPVASGGAAPLNHLGVIRITGADAATFIHNQLTQDFLLLPPQHARLAAFCSAKGRMQTSFIGFKPDADTVLLVCSQDLLAATLKRLRMFVLRAKAVLDDASADFALFGCLWPIASTPAAWTLTADADGTRIQLYPGAGCHRALWIGPAGSHPALPELPVGTWLYADVMSGVATISQPLFEALVPQMLNYESVGGVNFKKGCYPGQEVVARSQFRGTLKRRAYIVRGSAPMGAGQEIFSAMDAEQACGVVVQAAVEPGTGAWVGIAALQVQAAEQGGLALGSAGGVSLALLPLPYALLDDV
jgi:folate-binding protein YgfZ